MRNSAKIRFTAAPRCTSLAEDGRTIQRPLSLQIATLVSNPCSTSSRFRSS